MPRTIDRILVQQLVREGAQLVDVRDAADFGRSHITGALSLPLRELTADAAKALDPSRPVITYCHDYQ